MKVSRINLLFILMFLALPVVMHAQGGCVDSPEAPTDVLMLVGSAGMVFGSSLVVKLARKSRR